jgi:hypothetical protein
MSAKSKARKERQRAAQIARSETALAITCPACGAKPGVWCFWRHLLGPDMHERRYAATSKES